MSGRHTRDTACGRGRLAACVCLIAFLSQTSSLLPSLVTAAAWLEGSHGIVVFSDGEGCEVILTHDPSTPTLPGTHPDPWRSRHHGGLAGMLCALAQAGTAEPDHHLAFLNSPLAESEKRQGVPPDDQAGVSLAVPPKDAPAGECFFSVNSVRWLVAVSARGSPAPPGQRLYSLLI